MMATSLYSATSPALQDQILRASQKNSCLLTILAQTDHARTAIASSQAYLADLEQEASIRKETVATLRSTVMKEQAEHETYRDSTMKRFAFRAAGKKAKFESRAEKEEKEYLEAVQKHFNASQDLERLHALISEYNTNIAQLKSVAQDYDTTQRELDALYNSIFAGPTPAFPHEDRLEQAVANIQAEYDKVAACHNVISQTCAILADAQKAMAHSVDALAEARDHSRTDMFFSGSVSMYADMAERSALSKAQMYVGQVEMLLNQAERLHFAPGQDVTSEQQLNFDIGLRNSRIAQGHVMSDIIFDNIFSDMAMHDEIKQSQSTITACAGRLADLMKAAREGERQAKGTLHCVEGRLAEARKELESVRSEVFASVIGFGGARLPPYSS